MLPNALPDVGALLAPTLARTPAADRPLLIALAERMAAQRYRAWAADAPGHAAVLLECAAREESIAEHVEGLHPDAPARQAGLRDATPELDVLNRTLFEGLPLRDQFTVQARGERLGAATWRALAAASSETAETYLLCAELEERSAEALESILAETAP